jgi:uncharacterized protein (DUF4213/DUF364 family)
MELVVEWLSDLRRNYSGEPLVSDVRVGVFYTAVEISTGDVGVAFTPRDLSDTVCCPKTAAGAPPAGRLIGARAWEAAECALSPSALRRAVGVATLNALSAAAIERHGVPEGTLQEKLDALDAAVIVPDDRVVMVGAFVPFIKSLKGRVAGLSVIDKHPDALKPDEQTLWISPQLAVETLRNASVVVFSGSALVEGGIEGLLQASRSARIPRHGGTDHAALAAAILRTRHCRPWWYPGSLRQGFAHDRRARRLRLFVRTGCSESLHYQPVVQFVGRA